MNTKLSLSTSVLVLALVCAVPISIAAVRVSTQPSASAQQPKDGQDPKDGKEGRQGPGGREGREGREGKGGNLEDAMQMLQSSSKRLDKAFGKKDAPAILGCVVDMQRAVLDAKTKTPPKAEEIKDAKEKEAFVAGFRKQLVEMQKALCDAEIAVIDSKLDDAKKIIDTTVKPLKQSGHDKYKGD